MKPGAVVVGVLVGAQETKVRPAVVIASTTYLAERPDAVVGILTTKVPRTPGTTVMTPLALTIFVQPQFAENPSVPFKSRAAS